MGGDWWAGVCRGVVGEAVRGAVGVARVYGCEVGGELLRVCRDLRRAGMPPDMIRDELWRMLGDGELRHEDVELVEDLIGG